MVLSSGYTLFWFNFDYRVYNAKANELFGEYANLNIID
jgi:hypothetical protein